MALLTELSPSYRALAFFVDILRQFGRKETPLGRPCMQNVMKKLVAHYLYLPFGLCAVVGGVAWADNTPQTLPFSQDWSNTNLITLSNGWSAVPGMVGYRGDSLTTTTGTDPQTITADGTSTPVNVQANQGNPSTN